MDLMEIQAPVSAREQKATVLRVAAQWERWLESKGERPTLPDYSRQRKHTRRIFALTDRRTPRDSGALRPLWGAFAEFAADFRAMARDD